MTTIKYCIIILLTIALLSFLLVGCKLNNYFQEFCLGLPILRLPISLDCGIQNSIPTTHISDMQKYSRYMAGDLVCGRIAQSDKYVAILYGIVGDAIYPAIFTFTNEGNRIDSLEFMTYCEGEPGYHSHSFAYISSDTIFAKYDTITTANLDSRYQEIPGTDSIFVLTLRYKINSSGHFENIEDSKKILHP